MCANLGGSAKGNMPRPAQRAPTIAISSPSAPSTVSRGQVGGEWVRLHHRQTKGLRGLTRFVPSTVTPSIWQTSGSLLPRILKSQICRARRVPSNSEKPFMAGPHPPPPNSSTARRARRGRDRRFKAMQDLNDGKLRCYVRAPRKGTREVAITAAPDRKERTRQPWFAVGFF